MEVQRLATPGRSARRNQGRSASSSRHVLSPVSQNAVIGRASTNGSKSSTNDRFLSGPKGKGPKRTTPATTEDSHAEDLHSGEEPGSRSGLSTENDSCTVDPNENPPSPDLLAPARQSKRRNVGRPVRFSNGAFPLSRGSSSSGGDEPVERAHSMPSGERRPSSVNIAPATSPRERDAANPQPQRSLETARAPSVSMTSASRAAYAAVPGTSPPAARGVAPSLSASVDVRAVTSSNARPTSASSERPHSRDDNIDAPSGHDGGVEAAPLRRFPVGTTRAPVLGGPSRGRHTSADESDPNSLTRGRLAGETAATSSGNGLGANFGRIGTTTTRGGRAQDEGGVGDTTITEGMTGEEINRVLHRAGTPRTAKAALCGILMSEVAPHMMNSEHSNTTKKTLAKGERGTNGVVSNVMVPYSYAFMGDAKKEYSGGQLPNKDNNAFVAVASHVFPAGQAGDPKWQAKFTDAVAASRAYVHADTRQAMVPIGLSLLEHAHKANRPRTITDLFRGARERIRRLDPECAAYQDVMDHMLGRLLSAHSKAAGASVEASDVFGGDNLEADFAQEVAIPLVETALCDAEYWPVPYVGELESTLCLAERKMNAFTERRNGGFATRKHRLFQNELWYRLFNFATGPRRLSHPLTTMDRDKFGDDSITLHVAPYAEDDSGDSSPRADLIVHETPFEHGSTTEDEDKLEILLDNDVE